MTFKSGAVDSRAASSRGSLVWQAPAPQTARSYYLYSFKRIYSLGCSLFYCIFCWSTWHLSYRCL